MSVQNGQRRPRLAFVSPLFLFPNDAGGKIRTTNILRGLKGGAFEIKLMSPATPAQVDQWRTELDGVCDQFVPWPARPPLPRWRRGFDLLGTLPVNVAADRSESASALVAQTATRGEADLIVFDFVHASVLRPPRLAVKSVCFTHNVEAEIFERHAERAGDPLRRWMWRSQHRKMLRFEGPTLRAYDKVIAVSERDARAFETSYGVTAPEAIPTGVDLDFFEFDGGAAARDTATPKAVFIGSMDSAANIDGVSFFLAQVWAPVRAALPQAQLVVVGRHPPAALVALGKKLGGVEFTGSVPDIRPFVRDAQVSVIPLRVGGGTRIKAFEAMAMGCPVVSTAIGIEGLNITPGEHFLQADDGPALAAAVLQLFRDRDARVRLAAAARAVVEARFGHRVAAQVFEDICLRALRSGTAAGALA